MISILVVFYLFVFLFAVIGAMRGWAKEMLVIFSVILALAFIAVLERYIPGVAPLMTSNERIQFWLRISILLFMVFFGYQTPKLARFSAAAERRDRIQDLMLGFIMGAFSGYFVIGTIWSFAHSANYPFGDWILPPNSQQPLGEAALNIVNYLPPVWLGQEPTIYIITVLAFIFVIIVFI
jgi:hypothetical protein